MKVIIQTILLITMVLLNAVTVKRLSRDTLESKADWFLVFYSAMIMAIGSVVFSLGLPELIWG